ncbi:MAG: peptide deformylase [Synergistaceae bacterium]|jgi:peptide deformylase|nr:peptide deformylase [Synergistaceae bacterium]
MAILDILVYPDPALRAECSDVTEFGDKLKKLVTDMFETMYLAKGVGLAAPQVGIPLRMFVADWNGDRHVIINPEIYSSEGAERSDEGCLSFPGIYEDVTRPEKISIRYRDENGDHHDAAAEGFLARVFAHETDHLNGRLMIDHLSALKRTYLRKKLEKKVRSA